MAAPPEGPTQCVGSFVIKKPSLPEFDENDTKHQRQFNYMLYVQLHRIPAICFLI